MSNQASKARVGPLPSTIDLVNASLKRRYAAEKRFRFLGMGAVVLGLLFVAILFADIIGKGYTAFQQTYIRLPIRLDPDVIGPLGSREQDTLSRADYQKLVRSSRMSLAGRKSARSSA